MKEETAFKIVFSILVLLAIVSIALPYINPGDYVKEYHARISFPVINEKYIFHLTGERHYLFRNWDAPVSCEDKNNTIVPLVVKCPEGSEPYAYSSKKELCLGKQPGFEAEANEVGCYSKYGFLPGEYSMEISYKTNPPKICQKDACFYFLSLASKHIPYKMVRIEVDVIPIMPPSLEFSSEKDEPIKIAVMESGDASGFFNSQIRSYYIHHFTRISVDGFFLLLTILIPAGYYWTYTKFGRDKDFTVPNVINYIPARRKPWIVDRIFTEPVGMTSINWIMATLLDMHMRGKIKITEKKSRILFIEDKHVELELVDDSELDGFEGMVAERLRELGGKVTLTDFVSKQTSAPLLKTSFLDRIMDCCKSVINQFVEEKFPTRKLALLLFIVSPFLTDISFPRAGIAFFKL